MRRRVTAVTLACLIAGAGLAQSTPDRASIEGRVTAPDGTPVCGAAILMQRVHANPRWPGTIAKIEGDQVANTDKQGRYRAAQIRPGRWFVAGIADGHAVGEYGVSSEWRTRFPLDLTAGEKVSDIDFVLPWRWELKGRCLDGDGEPVDEVPVLIIFELVDGGRCIGGANARSGRSGLFESDAVPVGSWSGFDGPVRAKLSVPSWFKYRFEDRVVGPIAPGAGVVHDSGDWRALPSCSLHGVVERRDRREREEARVAIGLQETEVAENGEFRFQTLPPGPIRLRIVPGIYGVASTPVSLPDLLSGEERGPIRLVIEPPKAISGRVVDERGTPFKGAVVEAFPAGGGWIPDDEFPPRTECGPDGRFELRGVPPGEWNVVVGHGGRRDPPSGSTAKVQSGAKDVELVLRRPWRLRYRATHPPDAAESTWLRTHSPGSMGPEWFQATTTDDGAHETSYRDPVPLEIQISCGDRARWIGSIQGPERGSTMDLGDLAFAAASRIEGTVVDAAGRPVRHPRVLAIHLASGVLVDDLDDAHFGDLKGRFAIERLPAGEYALFAVTPGQTDAFLARLEVAGESTTSVQLVCREAAPLELRVLAADGKPIKRADIHYRLDGFPYWFERDFRAYHPRSHGPDWTDAEGRLARPLMPAGGLDLQVRKKGYQTKSLRIEPGDSRSIIVRLAK